ncbi:hypothetical protein ACFS7Z_26600 [Pontibacter toksunensis]|uniref:Uncharacterized protein n=1 Tax=Pontibacter toksunensis TaxID=1332631 RepID=A0ABW6C2M7_9BACT
MHFDLDRFFDRLQEEALTRQQAKQAIHGEIRDAEAQKVAFLDQATENPEFYRFLNGQINRYILYLKVLYNRISPQGKREFDVQGYDTGSSSACHTMRLLLQLEQLEKSRAR